jgi:hypothetical protein
MNIPDLEFNNKWFLEQRNVLLAKYKIEYTIRYNYNAFDATYYSNFNKFFLEIINQFK